MDAQEQIQLSQDVSVLMEPQKWQDLNPDSLDTLFQHEGYDTSPFFLWKGEGKRMALFSDQPYSNVTVNLTALGKTVPLAEAGVAFSEGKLTRVGMEAKTASKESATKAREAITKALGAEPRSTSRPANGWLEHRDAVTEHWDTELGTGSLAHSSKALAWMMGRPGETLPQRPLQPAERSPEANPTFAFFVRLDHLIRPQSAWQISPEALENMLSKPEGLKDFSHFEWTTTSREGARFSKQPFSNIRQELLMFDDTVQAEEALVEFKGGKATRWNISLLNRGDSGNISSDKFQAYYKAAGRALGSLMGVSPRSHRVQGQSVSKVEGWIWANESTVATLEYNAEAMKGQVEFLRLRMAPAKERSTLVHVSAIGGIKSQSQLATNVKKNQTTSDVIVSGIPMVDQGQKGYCVAASCQRVLNYLGIACDQHELATLLQTSADEGTNLGTMYQALNKVDSRYNTKFKTLKANVPFTRMTYKELEKYQKPALGQLVRENINRGQPLLWAVQLDRAPAEKGLPQTGGGHMRLIIGYNENTGAVVYSDSWGAGHEMKVMSLNQANECTDAVFVMESRR